MQPRTREFDRIDTLPNISAIHKQLDVLESTRDEFVPKVRCVDT